MDKIVEYIKENMKERRSKKIVESVIYIDGLIDGAIDILERLHDVDFRPIRKKYELWCIHRCSTGDFINELREVVDNG